MIGEASSLTLSTVLRSVLFYDLPRQARNARKSIVKEAQAAGFAVCFLLAALINRAHCDFSWENARTLLASRGVALIM